MVCAAQAAMPALRMEAASVGIGTMGGGSRPRR
jgi:hypothetical protein